MAKPTGARDRTVSSNVSACPDPSGAGCDWTGGGIDVPGSSCACGTLHARAGSTKRTEPGRFPDTARVVFPPTVWPPKGTDWYVACRTAVNRRQGAGDAHSRFVAISLHGVSAPRRPPGPHPRAAPRNEHCYVKTLTHPPRFAQVASRRRRARECRVQVSLRL